jgi:L,D-transpeptidase catalytic domain
MAREQTRLKRILIILTLAAMAPSFATHAQGFSSVSSGAHRTAIAAPSGTGTGSTGAAVAASVPPAVGAPTASATLAVPATAAVVPVLASALPPPPAFGGSLPAAAVAAPTQPAAAGSASPTMPPPAAAVPVAAAPTAASGSFSSVSGSAPVLPAPPPPAANYGAGSVSGFEMAEKVVVVKHERKLRLYRRGRVIAEYPIKLGLNPYGHKQREGDFRTPEGKYELVSRNPQSEFFLSIKISYPNREDAAVASENGYAPGGLIMIHGQPNVPKRPPEHYAKRDWTDGCIALSNADMVDVWMRTTPGIPIEIRP